MSRTSEAAVKLILDRHYDTAHAASLVPFIDTASSLVDKISTNDTTSILSATDLEIIERWLSAHFYAQSDQLYTSKSTGKASGSFQGQTGMQLENTIYGQQAMLLDASGYLSALQKGGIVGGFWLGKTKSQRLSFRQRMGS